jgi:hypothetical protein
MNDRRPDRAYAYFPLSRHLPHILGQDGDHFDRTNILPLRNPFTELIAHTSGEVTGMKKSVFWNVTPCDSSRNRRFGGTYRLQHQVTIGEIQTTLTIAGIRTTLRRNTIKHCSYLADSCQPNNREDTFLRNVGSDKSHTAL